MITKLLPVHLDMMFYLYGSYLYKGYWIFEQNEVTSGSISQYGFRVSEFFSSTGIYTLNTLTYPKPSTRSSRLQTPVVGELAQLPCLDYTPIARLIVTASHQGNHDHPVICLDSCL